MTTRLEQQQQEEKIFQENRALSLKDNKQFESSEIDEIVNVTTEGLDMKVENAGTAEVENVEFNEAGNVILCCFAAFLLHLYFLDL